MKKFCIASSQSLAAVGVATLAMLMIVGLATAGAAEKSASEKATEKSVRIEGDGISYFADDRGNVVITGGIGGMRGAIFGNGNCVTVGNHFGPPADLGSSIKWSVFHDWLENRSGGFYLSQRVNGIDGGPSIKRSMRDWFKDRGDDFWNPPASEDVDGPANVNVVGDGWSVFESPVGTIHLHNSDAGFGRVRVRISAD